MFARTVVFIGQAGGLLRPFLERARFLRFPLLSGLRAACAALSVLFLVPGLLLAGPAGGPPAGLPAAETGTFRVIHRNGGDMGLARLLRAGPDQIEAELDVGMVAVGGFRGRVRLWRPAGGGSWTLLVDGRGRDGKVRRLQETVRPDAFLLGQGVLTFRWESGRRFFQFSRDSRGVPKVVTDWGTVSLVKP